MPQPDTIAVLGAGRSGQAAAALAIDLGLKVHVYETGVTDDSARAILASRVCEIGAEWHEEVPAEVQEDLAVLSPGLAPDTELWRRFHESGIATIGELEFGWRHTEAPAIAITGTNGKTTTTEMIGHVLRRAGLEAPLGGNHGEPLSSLVLQRERRGGRRPDWLVLEVSSFQIEEAPTFHPRVVVWTNFAADHLDRYANIDEYRRAKLRIFDQLDQADRAILPDEEDLLLGEVPTVRFGFTSDADFRLDEEGHMFAHGVELGEFRRWRVAGRHNALNGLAALAACEVAGIHPEESFHHLATFRAAAHRYEKLAVVSGVEYINDSKATNLHAMASALRADTQPLHLLAGGFDKGLDWTDLLGQLPGRLLRVHAYGQTGPALAEAWGARVEVRVHEDLDQALQAAAATAEAGEQVLLSPGTSSFDQFPHYVRRGEHFRRLVERLESPTGA